MREFRFRAFVLPLILVLVVLLPSQHSAAQIGSSGIGNLIKAVDYKIGQSRLADSEGIDQEDLKDLEAGRLLQVKRRYEAKPQDSLSLAQLRLLCDLQIGFGHVAAAGVCLEKLLVRVKQEDVDGDPKPVSAVLGRIALLNLTAARFSEAAKLSAEMQSDGGRYIYALASAKSGNTAAAERVAEEFARGYFFPRHAFFAATIWLTLNQCNKSLDVLLSPRTRLERDYGLKVSTGALGNQVNPTTFRLDLFEDFKFGLFDAFSYAPRANQYVEFITGYCLVNTGKTNEGRERLMMVLNDTGAQASREVLWMTQYELAKLAASSGDRQGAEQYLNNAMSVIEEIRSSITTDTGRIGFIHDKFDVYETMAMLQFEGNDQQVLETLERSKGRALVDLLSEKDDLRPAGGDSPDGLALLDEMVTTEAAIARPTSGDDRDGQTQLVRSLQQSRSRLTKTAPRMSALVSAVPSSYQQLAGQLETNEACLLYHQFGDSLYAMVVRAGSVSMRRMDSTGLKQEVELFRASLGMKDGDMHQKSSLRLYDRLVRPFESTLAGVTKITIVPTAGLFYLPFAALSDGKKFLIERAALRVLPSLSALALIDKAQTANSSLLVLGNPDLGDQKFDLPGAESEARSLASRRPGSTLLLRGAATEVEFGTLSPSYGLLHLATHGQFNAIQPLLSRLLLAPGPDSDGQLTANELYGLRLHADLVVMSGCETAMSAVASGDDMIGLLTGFIYAGAKGVVGSLWRVSDNATEVLMSEFYSQLDAGLEPSAALRQAQIHTMQKYQNPISWAAFVYYGEDQRILTTASASK